jgi:DNA-binding Xre family transcriptional regulator
MTRQRLVMRWNLRTVMAERGLFQTSDLVPLLEGRDIHLSRQYVHRLVTKAPHRLNIDLLAALCDILDCGPSDLLQPVLVAAEEPAAASGETGPGIGDLRPVRARIVRPGDST